VDRFTLNQHRNDLQHIVKYISPAKTHNFSIFVCFLKIVFSRPY